MLHVGTPEPRRAAVPAAIVPPGQEHLLQRKQASRRPPGPAQMLPTGSSPLVPGWNLVSIPETPTDTAPAAVLASIAGSYDLVYAYRACDGTDPWKLYDPNAPVAGDLAAIDNTVGLWIHMTAADTLTVSGIVPASTAIQLCPGWNLIGYPWAQPVPVAGALNSIAGKYTRVFAYDFADTADPWAVYERRRRQLCQRPATHGSWLGVLGICHCRRHRNRQRPAWPIAASLTSHDDGAEITSPISVTGRITSTTPAAWVMAYRREEDAGWTTFGSGDTSVSSQPQAQFDPTLLLNGIYKLRLTATDLSAKPPARRWT